MVDTTESSDGSERGRHRRRLLGADSAAATEHGATTADPAGAGRRPAVVLLLTAVGSLVPGLGLIVAGRRRVGWTVLVLTVAAAVALGVWIGRDPVMAASALVSAGALRAITVGAIAVAVLWSVLVVVTHRALRPADSPVWLRSVGAGVVGVLCLLVATPTALVAGYAQTTESTIETIFAPGRSATVPTGAPRPAARDPWADIPRVNILLLGGDAGPDRTGVRTDSMAVASIDTKTGRTVLISVPRSIEKVEFQPGTPLANVYPDGYVTVQGNPDSGENLLNSVYRNVPAKYPEILGATDNEGADALKLGIGYSLGLSIDYYVLIQPAGFQQLVTALGGYTADINQPVAVGGNTDTGELPSRWLMPGPAQHLNGYLGTWFARGRYGSDRSDYDRVRRQQCAVQALAAQTSPARVLLAYNDLAKTAADATLTDIPRGTFAPLVQLARKVKQANRITGVNIDSFGIPGFSPVRPDWDSVRQVVAAAVRRSTAVATPRPATTTPAKPAPTRAPTVTRTPTATPPATPQEDLATGCAYDPAAASAALAQWEVRYGSRFDATTGLPR